MPPAAAKSAKRPRKQSGIVNAETMAKGQREISVSEFFAKNRHLLGFDNPRKALLTTVKEAVDNALDACEEAGMLPDLFIGIEQLSEARFRITIRDNGPGIVKSQVANIFGKLLYGSKFHRLKMSRGQQGIGIAAAGMYGLMTTGKPMVIHTKPHKSKPSHCITLAIDTQKNKADITDEVERHDFPSDTGTEVVIELEGKYNKGRQSVDEYLEQTAIANPHSQIIYQPPTACRSKDEDNGKDVPTLIDDYEHAAKLAPTADGTTTTPGGTVIFPRTVKELPEEPKEIKPHPKGIELGTLLKMLRTSDSTQLGGFLQKEFCRVSLTKANEICDAAQKIAGGDSTITNRTWVKNLDHESAEKIYRALQETKLRSPPTDCLAPIGVRTMLAGMLKGVKAEFLPPARVRRRSTGATRSRSRRRWVRRGPARAMSRPGDPVRQPGAAALPAVGVLRVQERVSETSWKNYGMSQPARRCRWARW
jgi:DNA topoisomerase-6 subunit B